MKTKRTLLALLAFGVLPFAAALAPADEHPVPAKKTDPAQALSPELRQLLVKEMQLIDAGMGQLLSAISAGDWKSIETIATKIQHSFILKQQLTEHQLHELHGTLPGEFVRMDVQFHETAGKLAAIAADRDAELATFYYSRLVDGCVNCHAAFAAQRFPGLGADAAGEHRH
jgi:hypothetical protein